MKLILLLLLSLNAFSQLEVGAALGGSNKAGLVNGQVGYDIKHSHFYGNQIIHFTSLYSTPNILGVRYGYKAFGFEPSVGLDYHLLSSRIENDSRRGFQLGYGLSYKFNRWFLQAGVSNDIYYGTVGIFKIN